MARSPRNVFGDGMQAQLDRLCRQLAIPTVRVGVAGALPSEAFAAAAKVCRVKAGTMPETSASIASQSGLKGASPRWSTSSRVTTRSRRY